MRVLATLGALAAATVIFEETFEHEPSTWATRWERSDEKGEHGPAGTWEHTPGDWHSNKDEAFGLAPADHYSHHGLSTMLPKPFSSKGRTLVVQYTVKHEKKEPGFCAGGYIKLLGSTLNQAEFGGKTDYKIMFGPDICGHTVSRIHAIFNYKGETLLRKEDIKISYEERDELTHLYTLVVEPDNTYEVFMDKKSKAKGSIKDDWNFPQGSPIDIHGYDDIGAVGFELWTPHAGSIFDNVLVADSLDDAWAHAAAHWEKISAGEKAALDAFHQRGHKPISDGDL